MKYFLIFILAIISGAQLFARVGDNEAQIGELFGKPVNSGFPDKRGISTNTYQTADYLILVQFLRDLSIAESYTRLDKGEFSEKELAQFLEGRSFDSNAWTKDPNKQVWERVDHHARAWCETISGRPTFLIQVK